VRLERKPKNIKPLLEQLAGEGFASYAVLTTDGLGPAKSLAARE